MAKKVNAFFLTRLCKRGHISLRLFKTTDDGAEHKLNNKFMKPGIYSASNRKQTLNSLRLTHGPTMCTCFAKGLLIPSKVQLSRIYPDLHFLIKKARGMEFLERKASEGTILSQETLPCSSFIFYFSLLNNANPSYTSLVNDQQYL